MQGFCHAFGQNRAGYVATVFLFDPIQFSLEFLIPFSNSYELLQRIQQTQEKKMRKIRDAECGALWQHRMQLYGWTIN